MLTPKEIGVGALADAKPLSLLLPRTEGEETFIVGGNEKERVAVFIREECDHPYYAFIIKDNRNWQGALINNIEIELDHTSLFNPGTTTTPLGAVVRKRNGLFLSVRSDPTYSGNFVALEQGLDPIFNMEEVGFFRWQVVLRVGEEKLVLKSIDVTPTSYKSIKP